MFAFRQVVARYRCFPRSPDFGLREWFHLPRVGTLPHFGPLQRDTNSGGGDYTSENKGGDFGFRGVSLPSILFGGGTNGSFSSDDAKRKGGNISAKEKKGVTEAGPTN